MAEVEAYVDVAIMYAILIGLSLLAVALLLPELYPR
jgi:tetrahydromethanopterin S-methyltransferase subunit G